MTNVLLLNANFAPISTISLQRAVTLVLTGRADIIEYDDEREFRSPSVAIPVPFVVRLLDFVRLPFRKGAPLTRRNLKARDNGECQVSGCTQAGTTIDHVTPRSRGGENSFENCVMMCYYHNNKKDSKLLSELGWTLKAVPQIPRGIVALTPVYESNPSWENYLLGW